jgi:hypothetical protein
MPSSTRAGVGYGEDHYEGELARVDPSGLLELLDTLKEP